MTATTSASALRTRRIPATLLASLLLAAACGGQSTERADTGGSGGTAQGGTGGTAGTAGTAGSAGTPGSSGTAGSGGTTGDASTDDGGVEGTRCDNGIGVGGDGCADNFPWGDEMGFSVDPPQLNTNHGAAEPVVVRGASFYTIPEPVLQVLQSHTSLSRVDGGGSVDVESTWSNSLTWDQHEVLLTLAPAQPLAEGWYLLAINGSLDTGHNTPVRIPSSGVDEYKTLFRVGSAPIFVTIENCVDSVVFTMSELVEVPDPLPITLQSNGATWSCTRELDPSAEPSPATFLSLRCVGLDTWKNLELVVGEGFVSTSQVPLRNPDGDTSFAITMAGEGTGGGCRKWEQVGVPAF